MSTRLLAAVGAAAALVALAAIQPGAAGAETPTQIVRSTTEEAMALLRETAGPGKGRHKERMERLRGVILPRVDSWEVARRSLGVHWQQISQEQRKEFVDLFIELVEKTYGGMLDRYTDEVQFFFDQERVDGRFAEVDTRIVRVDQPKPFSVSYRLRRREGKWLIYDVVIENVSMVSSYRNQFGRIINKSSYEGLVKAIRRKLKQLEEPPPSSSS